MKKSCLSILLASLIIGCGGGGGSDSSSSSTQEGAINTKGYLVDSPVQGAGYVNGGKTLKTGIGGTFTYGSGDISFYIGDIKIGTLNSLPSDNIVTLQDLLHVERDDINNPTLLKVATFIQSIDEDMSTNAIEISDDSKYRGYNQNAKDLDLEKILTQNGLHVKSESYVKSHLDSAFKKIVTDDSLPKVQTTKPKNGTTKVSTTGQIEIIFSKNMPHDMFSANSVILRDMDSNFAPSTILIDKNILKIIPKNPLKNGERYSVSLSGDIKDYKKAKMEDYSFHFTTKSASSSQGGSSSHGGSSSQGGSSSHGGSSSQGGSSSGSNTPQGDIVFKGYAYNLVTSPMTKRVWLDRNLGARKVCESKGDEQCYGDYYQWGRRANGHEKKSSDIIDVTRQGYDGIENDVDSGGKFATWRSDWKKVQDDSLWQGVNGKNNPCPPDFRVPTIDEVMIETKEVDKINFPTQVLDGQYTNLTNFLKLPNNGYRKHLTRDGIIENSGYSGGIWTSTTSGSLVYKFDFFPGGAWKTPVARAFGYGVRCIKDYKDIIPFNVLDTYPSEGDTDIKITSSFRIVFSKPVSELSRSNFAVRRKSDGIESPISIIRKKTNNIVEFTLDRSNSTASGGLEYDTEYELVVNTNIHDTSGIYLKSQYIISFKTKASK